MGSKALIILGVILTGIVILLLVLTKQNITKNERPSPSHDPQPEPQKEVKPTGLGFYDSKEDQEDNEKAHSIPRNMLGHGIGGNKYAPNYNMETQYGGLESVRQMHPVLAYQYMHDKAINPANLGDPIRIPDVIGGRKTGLYGSPRNFLDSLSIDRSSVPVPMGSLKATNEKYNRDMFRFNPMATGTIAMAAATPTENFSIAPLASPVTPHGAMLPRQTNPFSNNFFNPYGPNVPVEPVPFIGSVNAYAPFPSIQNPWEKAGILTSVGGDQILNLYRRPIAPLQDLWEYQVQDKDGFVIKLENTKYLEDGDLVPFVVGKAGQGPWKAHIFVQNKYIWV